MSQSCWVRQEVQITHVYECACVCMRGWRPSDRYLCGFRQAVCSRRASALSPLRSFFVSQARMRFWSGALAYAFVAGPCLGLPA